MIMKRLILTCWISCLFSLCAPNTYACSCIVPEVPEAFRAARAVFIGEVTEITAPHTDNPKAPLADQLYTIKFKVERSWKGVRSADVIVLSDQGRAGCFSWGPFLKGKKYLVYGERRLRSGAHTRTLAVLFSCNRTGLLADASEDLKALGFFGPKSRMFSSGTPPNTRRPGRFEAQLTARPRLISAMLSISPIFTTRTSSAGRMTADWVGGRVR